jgi:hypothetical protein
MAWTCFRRSSTRKSLNSSRTELENSFGPPGGCPASWRRHPRCPRKWTGGTGRLPTIENDIPYTEFICHGKVSMSYV